ncbi:hypothetical protein BD289DRAFT_443126 [Coniella lustricola]|uniref:Secreted protein n=1 Tax=Coniella lustricola TaxID=2025994 RepID=A0A2T2ZXE8_9PEZI|nr:hypothetical protein BD289DRAFT_443126 [Coniella lustricola]
MRLRFLPFCLFVYRLFAGFAAACQKVQRQTERNTASLAFPSLFSGAYDERAGLPRYVHCTDLLQLRFSARAQPRPGR